MGPWVRLLQGPPIKEKRFFSTRKAIIDEIVRRAETQGILEEQAAEQMDREYSSLDKAHRAIKEAKKKQ